MPTNLTRLQSRILGALTVLVLSACRASGQTPPLVTSTQFRPWCDSYIQSAINSCPLQRATTIYFSPTGSDTTGNGSIYFPYQTIAMANSLLASSSGSIALLFARGGRYYSASGLNINTPAVTIGAYNPPGAATLGAKPLLTSFMPPIAANAWTPVSGGTYSTTISSVISWIKLTGDISTVFQQVGTLAAVESTPGSWCQVANTLYVQMPGGVDPRQGQRQIEWVPQNQAQGIVISDVADVRIDSIDLEGFGAGAPNDHSYFGYGVSSLQLGSHRMVVTNCEVAYNGRHNITKNGKGTGGSLVVVGCRLGWMANDNGNVVSYSEDGGQELVSAHNTFLGGELPASVNPFSGSTGQTNLCHTNGGTAYTGFMLCVDNTMVPGQFQCGIGSSDAAPQPFTDLADCRSFVVDEKLPSRNATSFDQSQTSSGTTGNVNKYLGTAGINTTVYLGCSAESTVLWAPKSGGLNILSNAGGIWINSTIKFDFTNVPPPNANGFCAVQNPSNNTTCTASYYNCNLDFEIQGGNVNAGFSAGLMTNPSGNEFMTGKLINCVISCNDLSGGQFIPGWHNDGVSMLNNSYPENSLTSGPSGCNLDWYRTFTPSVDQYLQTNTPLVVSVPQSIMGYVLQYDKLYRPRTAQSARGAYEAPNLG